MRRILVPVDGSVHSDRALKFAVCEYARPNDIVIVLTCVENTEGMKFAKEEAAEIEAQATRGMDILDHAKGLLIAEGKLDGAQFEVEEGSPKDVVSAVVKDRFIHSVVIGDRGRGAAKRMLMGSVSDYLVHHLHVPVIVVKAPKELHD